MLSIFFSHIQFFNMIILLMFLKSNQEGHEETILEEFSKKNPLCAATLLSSGILTNNKEDWDKDLLYIYDLSIFRKTDLAGRVDEISYLKRFHEDGRKSLLKHPLTEAFLHLKWQNISKFVWFNIFLYGLYLFFFTSSVVMATLDKMKLICISQVGI